MRAAQINEYGDTSVLKINETDKPEAGKGQVLVEVYDSSINPFDSAVRSGYMKEMIPLEFPATLGGDISGVIQQVGEGVENFSVGDEVYGQANVVAGNSGAFAEFSATSAQQVAKKPTNVDFSAAASLPLVGVSALQALTEHIKLDKGQKIFIHGGSGGIGTIAIQIAKNIGAYVATTAADDGIDYVKNLGADEVIDYKSQDFSEILKDYDAVFDNVGRDDFVKTFTILKKGGIAVTMIASESKDEAITAGVTSIRQMTQITTPRLEGLAKLVEDGVISTHVDEVFPFDEIQKAFEKRESGKVKGKVVIEIKKG